MKNAIRLILTLIITAMISGCAVYMATNQPRKRNLAVLKPGTHRDLVIAEFGAPVTSEKTETGRKEIYTFVQGYSKMAKAGRALFHGTADLFTIGLWEAVGTPIEGAFDGKTISVRVDFDKDECVRESKTLSIESPKASARAPVEATGSH